LHFTTLHIECDICVVCIIVCLHCRHGRDMTVLSCPPYGGVNWIGDKSRQFSVVSNIFETEQLQIGNWVETRQNSVQTTFRDRTELQNCLVWLPVQFTPQTRTRRDSFVLSMSVMCTRYKMLMCWFGWTVSFCVLLLAYVQTML